MKKTVIFFCLIASMAFNLASQSLPCGTLSLTQEEKEKLPFYGNNNILVKFRDSLESSSYKRMSEVTSELFWIPVRLNYFRRADGTGTEINDARCDLVLKRVNAVLKSNDSKIRLYRICAPSNTYLDNTLADLEDEPFDDVQHIFHNYAQAIYFNIHFVNSTRTFAGLSPLFKFCCPYGRPNNQTIISTGDYLGDPMINGGRRVYDDDILAKVILHELGHTLGLHHTHDNARGSSDNRDASICKQEYVARAKTLPLIPCIANAGNYAAEVNGDLLLDTEADPGLRIGDIIFVDNECNFTTTTLGINYPVLADRDGSVWRPNARNIMSYSRDACRNYLSPFQNLVMLMALHHNDSGYGFSLGTNIDEYESDNGILSATATRPEFFERQHHTIHAKCDEDWVRFEVGYFRKMVIETRAPFGMSDPSRYADTQIELYTRDAAGNPVLIASDDNSGTGNFSKIEMFLPAGTYFVRVTDQTPNLTLPLHYLIGVFNEFALWGDGSAGGAGNSGSGGIDIGSIGGGGFGASGSMPVVCPNNTLNILGVPSHPWIWVTWEVNNAMVYINPGSVFSAFISDAGYSGPLTITANVYYSGILIGSIIRDVWYGVPPASELFGPVTPRINPMRNWNIPIACQSDGLYFQAEYPTAVNYNSTTLQYQWEFTHSNNVPWTTIPPLPPFSLYTARNELLTNSLPVGRYWVRVRSRNECGWSAWSATAPLDGNEFLVLPTTDKECGNELIPPGGRKESPEKEKTYTIYPNPTKNGLNIRLDNENSAIISLYDKFGILKATTATEDGNAHLDLSNLAQDLYILKIQTPDAVFTEQVVKE